MSVPWKGMKPSINTRKVILLTLFIVISSVVIANASECYHHYNNSAWHGKGMAIVFCKNSGGIESPSGSSYPMAACEARYHNTSDQISEWNEHGNPDKGRQIFTDYGTPGASVNAPMDIICTGKNGKTYTYVMLDSNEWGEPGVCPENGGYVGGAACRNDHNPILKVTKNGIGTGSITGNVAGDVTGAINCGSGCSQDEAHYQFYSNKTVKLTATPDAGYRFLRWEGDCSGSGVCQVKMNADKNIVAVFGLGGVSTDIVSLHTLLLRPEYTVSPSVDDTANYGNISPDNPIKVKHGNKSAFSLSPETGYGASIDDTISATTCPGPVFSGPRDNTLTIGPVTSDCLVVTHFAPLPDYTVTSSVDGKDNNGTISPGSTVTIQKYSTVSYTLTPDSTDYKATSVSGSCPGGTLTYGTPTANSSTYVTGPIKGDCDVIAHFAESSVVVNASVNGGNGSVSPSGKTPFEAGNPGVFTLTPSPGYKAALVLDTCGAGGVFSNNNTRYTTTSLTNDCAVTFSFTQSNYTLNISVVGDGGVHTGGLDPSEDIFCYPGGWIGYPPDCTHDYPYGTVVTLKARVIPLSGSSFLHWTNCTSPRGDECDETIDKTKTVTATFTD